MDSTSILFADDDPLLRSIYVKKFSLAGYNVIPASNGEEALQLIKQNPPHLVVLDISMPKMDGFEVLKQLPKPRQFPVILLTNFDTDDYRKKANELGADGYFVKKDMTVHTLLDTVTTLLKKN